MIPLRTSKALDDLAQHLYDFLPGQAHPYADQSISFAGVAAGLGLGQYWPGGSKRPAIRRLLEGVLNSGRFNSVILKIVERSMTYRGNTNPLTREDIDRLNELLALLGYKIPDLHDRGFLNSLPRRESTPASVRTAAASLNVTALATLQEALLKLATLEPQPRGFAFEKFLSELFALYSLAPRGAFRLVGEQIDGSFQVGQEVYNRRSWHSGSNGTENSLKVCYWLGRMPSERRSGIETSSRQSYPGRVFQLSRQGAFPEQFAPEYGNQVEGGGNGQDRESHPCRSDSS